MLRILYDWNKETTSSLTYCHTYITKIKNIPTDICWIVATFLNQNKNIISWFQVYYLYFQRIKQVLLGFPMTYHFDRLPFNICYIEVMYVKVMYLSSFSVIMTDTETSSWQSDKYLHTLIWQALEGNLSHWRFQKHVTEKCWRAYSTCEISKTRM